MATNHSADTTTEQRYTVDTTALLTRTLLIVLREDDITVATATNTITQHRSRHHGNKPDCNDGSDTESEPGLSVNATTDPLPWQQPVTSCRLYFVRH